MVNSNHATGREMVRSGDAACARCFVQSPGAKETDMSSVPTLAPPGTGHAEQLAAALNHCFETLEAPAELFNDDAFFDLLPPFWRFQLQGADAFIAQLRGITHGVVTSRVIRVIPTSEGFVMEHEQTQAGPPRETARRVWICCVENGRIADVTCYCNGGWDDEQRARHATEAPMVRW
jgi:hypothetical protein